MLRYMTAGESHGKAMVVILDGVPAGLALDEKFINLELARRMIGYGRGKRMLIEKDKVDIIAGCLKGMTIGSPVSLMIRNKDYRIEELPDVKCPRPGHADLAGIQKYGLKGARGVLEKASARETVSRVAAGAVAKLLLKAFGVKILSHVTMIGGIAASAAGKQTFNGLWKLAEASDLRCADKEAAKRMRAEIDKAAKAGDTLGGSFEVVADGVPPGLGSYAQWDSRLDGRLARVVMAIPGVKAVSIGEGVECASKKGSQTHDEIAYDKDKKIFYRLSNNAGGMEGGMTNGMPVVIRAFMKPIATLAKPLRSVDIVSKKKSTAAVERADVTAVPACGVIAESVVALEIGSAFLGKFGGDSVEESQRNHEAYMKQLKKM